MINIIYGYKIPYYVYFTFINKICNEYKYLEITDNDTEDIEEHKQFLKLNLRYVINNRTEDNNFNYHKTIAPELITAIETCNIIKQYCNQIRNNYMKTILDQNIVEDDVIKHVFMSYTNNNNLDTINFKSIDLYEPENENSNYDMIIGISINKFESLPFNIFYDDKTISNIRDIVIECFSSEFKDYKCGIVLTNYE
jgi:hypothetical protein